jgi:hypothetical protein
MDLWCDMLVVVECSVLGVDCDFGHLGLLYEVRVMGGGGSEPG